MTEKELTWVAAVFDCEGCIQLQRQKQKKKDGTMVTREYPIVAMGHTSLDLITRFHELVGLGKVYTYDYSEKQYMQSSKKHGGKKHFWRVSKRSQVEFFIEIIWGEWLSEHRRSKARELGIAPE